MKVLNGRKRGDIQVHFTCVSFHGYCTDDPVLASEMSLIEAKTI